MSESKNYENLTISDLQVLCKLRNLSTTHRLKADLIQRLTENETNTVNTDDTENVFETNNGNSSSENNENSHEDSNIENTGDSFENSENSNENPENSNTNGSGEDENNRKPNSNNSSDKISDTEENTDEMTTISFRDVEDALKKFKGESYENVEEWILEFETTAATCKWSEVQKYLFARKLLRGEAKMAVEANQAIISYETLLTHLKEEHKDDATSADIHDRLMKRSRKTNETYVEYMYVIKKMGRDKVDERSLVKYVVNGLPDKPQEKITLLEAATLAELKKKLKSFEASAASRSTVVHEDNDKKNAERQRHQTKKKPQAAEGRKPGKCHNCGGEGHLRDICPDKDKGKKCYNCNMFGHIGKDCQIPKKEKASTGQKKGETMCLEGHDKRRMRFPTTVKNENTTSVLDTGSDWSLVRESFYKRCKMGKRDDSRFWMKGFAPEGHHAKGSVNITVRVENDDYELRLHVVEDNLIPEDILLGRDFLQMVTVVINKGVPMITKNSTEQDENDIFTIKVDTETDKPEYWPCVKNVQDDHLRSKVITLIKNYKPAQLRSSHIKMELFLQDNIPVYQHPRRLAIHEREVAKKMVDEFIQKGIARPSKSAWASPILLKKKPNGTYRFCADYRKLNLKIIKDRYPLPLMDDVLDSMSGHYVYSNLDLRNGFYHVDMHPDSIQYTAYVLYRQHQRKLKKKYLERIHRPTV